MSKSGEARTYNLFAAQAQTDKTNVQTTNARMKASKSSSESGNSDSCVDAGTKCDPQQHSQQDLMDFFGPKVK